MKRFKQWLCGLAGHRYWPCEDSKHHKICLYCGKEIWERGYMRPRKDKNAGKEKRRD